MSEQYTISIVVEGHDKGASGVLDNVGGSLRRVGEFVVGGLLVGGIQKVGEAIGGLAKNAIGSVSNIQSLEKSMQGLLAQNIMYERQADGTYKQVKEFGDASVEAAVQVKDLLGFVEELALASPFETADIEAMTKIGLAAGQSTTMVKDFTTAFMNTAAVVGITDIQFAAEQFLQLKQAGALATVDLRQLRRMGIDVARIIGTDMSGSVEEATARFGELSPEARKVFEGMDLDVKSFNATAKESPEVLDAIFQKFILLSEQTATGAAADMATTIGGMMNTAGDIVEIGSRKLFRPIFEALSPTLAAALGKVQDFVASPQIAQIGQSIGDSITKGIEAFERFNKAVEAGFGPLDALKFAITRTFEGDTVNVISGIIDLIKAFRDGTVGLDTPWEDFLPPGLAGIAYQISGAIASVLSVVSRMSEIVGESTGPMDAFRNIIAEFLPPDLASKILDITIIIENVIGFVQQLGGAFAGVGQNILNIILPAIPQLQAAFVRVGEAIGPLLEALQPIAEFLGVALVVAFGLAVGVVQGLIAGFLSLLETGANLLEGIIVVVTGIADTIVGFFQLMIARFTGDGELLAEATSNLSSGITTIFEGLIMIVTSLFAGMLDFIMSVFWSIVEGASEFLGKLPGVAGTELGNVLTTISGMAGKFIQIGKDLIGGIAQGIKDGASSVLNAINSTIQNALDTAKSKLGIQSPSTVMADIIGKPMSQGIGVGFSKEMPMVGDAMNKSLQATTNRMTGNTTNIDQRSFGGDRFDVQANDQGAMQMFLGFVEERKINRLNASMGMA